jgi:hypothetical protein
MMKIGEYIVLAAVATRRKQQRKRQLRPKDSGPWIVSR